jgi:hypothetical protein
MIASAAGVPVTRLAISLIVPSPPQASTTRAPRATAFAASSLACPGRSVTCTPPVMPAFTKCRMSRAVRSAATSGFAPAPESGLTIAKTSIAWLVRRQCYSRRAVRVALAIVSLVAAASTVFLIWTFEQQISAHESAARSFTATAHSAGVAVADLRGAQQGYVAAGQGPDFWFARVTAIGNDLHVRLASLKSLASAPDAAIAIDEAIGALQDFDQMDHRARDFTRAY